MTGYEVWTGTDSVMNKTVSSPLLTLKIKFSRPNKSININTRQKTNDGGNEEERMNQNIAKKKGMSGTEKGLLIGGAALVLYLITRPGAAAGGVPTLHNDLAGLQGGAGNEFYHLTSAEHADVLQNLNIKNILKDAEVTIENWVQEPSTIENILDEHDNTLSTQGIASLTEESKIIFDMKTEKRILLYTAIGTTTPANDQRPTFWVSNNGILYTQLQMSLGLSMSLRFATTPTTARYIMFWDDTYGHTYHTLGLRAYLI